MNDIADFRKTAPEVSDFGLLRLAVPEVFMVEGIKVVLLNNSHFPEVCRVAVVERGGAAEAGEPNVSQLSAMLLREGTLRRDGSEIADVLDSAGAWLSEMSLTHARMFTLHTLNSQLGLTIELLLELLTSPRFPEPIVTTHLQRMAASLEVALTRNDFIATRELKRIFYGEGNPLARNVAPEEILAYKPETFKAFNEKWLSAEGTTVYVAGNISPEVRAQLVEAFSRFGANLRSQRQLAPLVSAAPRNIAPEGAFSQLPGADRNQASVQMVIPVPESTISDMSLFSTLIVALGGYFGSRLMSNIREEKGLTYGISASIGREIDGNLVKITTECDSSKADIVLSEINREIDELATRAFSSDELTRVKRIVRSSKATALENVFSELNHRIMCDLRGVPVDEFTRQQELLDGLTSEQLSETAERLLVSQPRYTVVAG